MIKLNWKKKISVKKFFFIYIVNYIFYYKVIISEVYIVLKYIFKEEKKNILVLYLIGEYEI